MAKTKAEIRAFLDAQVGKTPIEKRASSLNGQCVTLIKVLMEFLGVPDPYKARGNAKDAGDTYIREGIGTSGRGWLTIAVNRSMGGGYGHIWIDLMNETNYESNGAKALKTTRGTRPLSQAQQLINFDKWVKADPITPPSGGGNEKMNQNDLNHIYQYGPLRRQRGAGEGEDVYLGKSAAFVIADHRDSAEGKNKAAEIDNAYKQAARVPALEAEIAKLKAQTSTAPSGEYVKLASIGTDIYVKK